MNRRELYSIVQTILVDDVPMAWMFEQQYPNVIDRQSKNVLSTAIGDDETFGSVSFA